MNRKITLTAVALGAVLLAGCGKDQATTETNGKPAAPLTHLPAAQVKVSDLVDIQPGYNLAVSYDAEVGQFEPLYKQVSAFASQHVDAFKTAAAANKTAPKHGSDKPTLSLAFTSIANTPAFAAVAANGSETTAAGQDKAKPIVARWVYLPHTQQVVTQRQLFPGNKLQALLSGRGGAGQPVGMEPVADESGKITEIRFVYLTPEADNADDAVTKVNVDVDELRDAIDPKYRELLGQSTKDSKK